MDRSHCMVCSHYGNQSPSSNKKKKNSSYLKSARIVFDYVDAFAWILFSAVAFIWTFEGGFKNDEDKMLIGYMTIPLLIHAKILKSVSAHLLHRLEVSNKANLERALK